MNESQDRQLQEKLRTAFGSPGEPDFEGWHSRHGDAVAYLNPVVTELCQRRRRTLMRMTNAAVAAVIMLAIVSSFFVTQNASFAETAKAINNAETLTWTYTTYMRFYSKDGKRTWMHTEPPIAFAYRAPNLYRCTHYDKEGNVRWVEIVDNISNRALRLDMNMKKATLGRPFNQYSGSRGPFAWVTTILESKPVELVGQREVNGMTVNVFRHCRENLPPHQQSHDIWLDANTKQLVGFSDPGADIFDLSTAPDRSNPAEKTFSKAETMGTIGGNIVFDPELDAELFSLTPPDGFEVVQESRPSVTEEELIEWLGVTARVNDGNFGDTYKGVDFDRHNEIARKDKADRTEAEQRFLDLWSKHRSNRNAVVMAAFANEYTVDGRFRYLGKGVKLGTADRIVLFYKLKSTGTYRAIYGDLTVKDIVPADLPLPVEE